MRIGLPIDISARELNGKLWLAVNLIEQGHEVVIGDISLHRSIDIFEPDVIFAHGASDYADDITETGCKILYMDTEGGVFHSKEDYADRITPLRDHVHTFFVWGDTQKRIACDVGYRNIKATGNPRFDLLQQGLRDLYKPMSSEIKETHGSFVLVNTNFALANAAFQERTTIDETIDKINSQKDWVKFKFIEFIQLIENLSNNLQNRSIVVRPHPSEHHDTYVQAFSEFDNVYVRYKYNVRPWIHAAEAVIHCGCTTGIESALMNTPTFAYQPKQPSYSQNLPNSVSETVETTTELLRSLNNLNGKHSYELTDEQRSNLKKYFHNVDCRAAPAIAKSFENIDGAYTGSFSPSVANRLRRVVNVSLGHKNVDRLRQIGIKDGWSYSRQKFPYVTESDLHRRIDFLTQFTNVEDVQVSRIRRIENTFLIQSSN